jgi:hypothetical protein
MRGEKRGETSGGELGMVVIEARIDCKSLKVDWHLVLIA